MGDSPRPIQERMIAHWYKVHPDFGRGVAEGLGIGAQQQAAE
jgi:catalase